MGMTEKPKIVVLTPVKNEAWILPRFLATTSLWADKIIIADQNSSDESVQICKRFDKVVLIRNESPIYDEAERQLLLIKTARELVSGPRILFALDADEILAANALETAGWQKILKAQPGTAVLLEKPDLYLSPKNCIRWRDKPFPIAYVDDGSAHHPIAIHSVRIPLSENTPRLVLDDVKVLHYAWANPSLQESKMRYYSVVENVRSVSPPVRRRLRYSRKFLESFKPKMESSERSWFQSWEEKNIDMLTIPSCEYTWHDLEILRHFSGSGTKRFYWDDIWYVNWEERRQYALKMGFSGVPTQPIQQPAEIDQRFRNLCADAFSMMRQTRERLRSALKGDSSKSRQ